MDFSLEQGQDQEPSRYQGIRDDIEAHEEVAEIANQEWEICNVIGKEYVNGVVYYLVEWNPTLMPEYILKNAKGLVNKFKAQLQAQARRGRSMQQKKQRGRSWK
jgi:hypothetical protein